MTRTTRRRSVLIALALVALVALGCGRERSRDTEVMLAVAASLRQVTPALARAYAVEHPGIAVVATYGASGDLRKQVEGGAPIDGVIFASAQPIDALIAQGKVGAASRRVLAQNQLVLIGPKGGAALTFATLAALPAGEKLAIGDPNAVPAGQYARDYLQALGVWDALKGRVVLGGDVSAVLTYARRGEVAAAVVYRTEIWGIEDVVVLDQPGRGAPRVEVVAGVVTEGKASAQAGAFLSFVASPAGQKVLADFGFGPP